MNSNHTGKTALVLAGGGLTGAVYEIGALRAIDDLLLDRSVNDFDIFVGTSAGALVASFLANGMSPEEMLQVIDGTHPVTPPIGREHVFGLNLHDYLSWGVKMPGRLLGAWTNYLRNLGDMTPFDLLWSLTEVLPSGLYDGLALESFLRQALHNLGMHNDFGALQRELFIIATELDTGERAVFGCHHNSDVPISLAVAASSALPIVYKPVMIDGEEYIDGGMRGTASIDLAIERGATLVVCINPLVPLDNKNGLQTLKRGRDGRYLSSKGIQSIANQTIRIFSHSGLNYHIKQIRRTHPEVDIILIEPQSNDYQMFYNNIMRYSARLMVARHGFESVTIDLAVDYPMYKEVLARHGIPISRRFVIEELTEIVQSNYDPVVIRRVLEARQERCGQTHRNTPLCQLDRVLAELETTLDDLKE